jgi:hypothetical protein
MFKWYWLRLLVKGNVLLWDEYLSEWLWDYTAMRYWWIRLVVGKGKKDEVIKIVFKIKARVKD